MTAEQPNEQVLTRIAFAERWLARARSQVASGNLPRGMLTLVLAGAEVRRTLEVAGAARPQRRLAPLVPAGLGLVLLAALAVGVATRYPGDEVAVAAGPAPRIITFSARTGELLKLIPSPVPSTAVTPALETPAAAAVPMRPALRSRSRTSSTVVAAPPVPAAPAAGREQPRAGSAAPPPAAPASAVSPSPAPQRSVAQAGPASGAGLTLADLIDLVLAAERTLRSDAAGR